jgi:hypothetical protein
MHVTKAPKKMGVFKNSGIQLNDEEQENELSWLNPFSRSTKSSIYPKKI